MTSRPLRPRSRSRARRQTRGWTPPDEARSVLEIRLIHADGRRRAVHDPSSAADMTPDEVEVPRALTA